MAKTAHRPAWTISRLKEGFERFRAENGHYPSALEVDACTYLCTSRFIQLKFGGLVGLRKLLDIEEVSQAVGENRRRIWERAGRLSLGSETEIEDFLVSRYGEVCVHEEKKYGNGRNRVDFFVYASEHFAVEVFNTYTLHGLAGNLNSKLRKYVDFPHRLFFVVTGGRFLQKDLDRIVARKTGMRLRRNMRFVVPDVLREECLRCIRPLRMPGKLVGVTAKGSQLRLPC